MSAAWMVLLAYATAAPAVAAPAGPGAAAPEEGAGLFGWGLDELFPVEEAAPQSDTVAQHESALFWTSCLLGVYAGPLWIPQTVTGQAPGPGYGREALMIWLVHVAPCVLVPLGVIPICGWAYLAFLLADVVYFLPIATTAAYDRSLARLPPAAAEPTAQWH